MHHPNTIIISAKAAHLGADVIDFVAALNGISLDYARSRLEGIKRKLAEIEAALVDPEPTVAHQRPAFIDQSDPGDENPPRLITGELDSPYGDGNGPVGEVA